MLSVRDHMAIRLAASHYKFPGARESDVFEQLGMTATRFWQHVHALLESPEALAAYPLEVRRLRRLRDARQRQRSSRRLTS